MDNCKVIAITNQKGGVGKTTTTVNLGVGLNQFYGKKVLLLDADPQSSLTIALGNKNPDALDDTLASAMNAVIDDRPFDETAGILHHSEGVDLLPSNIELSGMEVGLFNVMSREYVLRNYIDTVRKNYDYVLIDCMPSLGMMTINALAAADSVVIPSQPSFLSAKGLDLLLRSISKVMAPDEKVVVTLDGFEQRLMVTGLADFRNDLIRAEKPTEDVDGLLLKVIDAPTQKEKKKADREAR